jgi:hypothetical protein
MAHPAQGPRQSMAPAAPAHGQVSIAILSCTACGAVVRARLGNGSLTCDCGGLRRIVRIVEDARSKERSTGDEEDPAGG